MHPNQYEKTVLGACLLEEEADLDLTLSVLRPEHFGLSSHQSIFFGIQKLRKSEKPVNSVTLMHELDQTGELEGVGGMAYIADLTIGVPRKLGERLRHYADEIKESWRLRQIAVLAADVTRRAADGAANASELTQELTARLEAIAGDSISEDPRIATSIVGSLDRFIAERNMKRSPGLSFGISAIDRVTGGMMPGFQTAVGAGSGVGKTTFMCQCILAALLGGAPVDAFLLEPTRDQVIWRLCSLMTGIRYSSVVRPWTASDDEQHRMTEAASQLADMPLRLHDRSSLSLDEVLGKARLGINRYGTRLICLDYIQRLKIRESERGEPMRLRVGRASTALADLVKGTEAHSLLLSQITTGRKSGASGIPTMFDFRESSQIENDAATILLLHRNFDETQGYFTNDGAIFIPKQRFGPPCNLQLRFDPNLAAWTDQVNNVHS